MCNRSHLLWGKSWVRLKGDPRAPVAVLDQNLLVGLAEVHVKLGEVDLAAAPVELPRVKIVPKQLSHQSVITKSVKLGERLMQSLG